MFLSEGTTVLTVAAKNRNVDQWESVATALCEELSPEQVHIIPGNVPAPRAALDKWFCSLLCYVEGFPCMQ